MTVARSVRRGLLASGGWPRAGMNLEISFEDSLGTDTSPAGLNTLALTNTAIVPGINGLALDTQTSGFATKIGITADLKTTVGTLHRYFKRTDDTKVLYVSFSTNGGAVDEILLIVRGSLVASPNGLQVTIVAGGAVKIDYIKPNIVTDNSYHLASLVATGSEYLLYFDGVLLSGLIKNVDDPAHRGKWTGSTELSSIDSFTIGGIRRASVINNSGGSVDEFVKIYDLAQTGAEIAALFAIIGGEK